VFAQPTFSPDIRVDFKIKPKKPSKELSEKQ